MDGPPSHDVAEHLARQVHEVAGILNRAHAELVALVSRALDEDAWGGGGIVSPEHWLVLHAGLSRGRAAAIVAVARRRHELPVTIAAFEEGQLSVEQTATVARHAPSSHEASVAELAVHATVPQIQRAVSRYPFLPPTASADVPEPGPQLTMGTDGAGRFVLRYHAPADVGALVETAIREAKDALFTATGQAHTIGEALTHMLASHLDAATAATPSRRRSYRVLVHLETSGVRLNGRPPLPDHLSNALTCDTTITPLWEREGRPVALGRQRRTVPATLRALIIDRDRGCRFPGCPSASGTGGAHVDVHHIIHWREGGPTDPENLLSLCSRHHDRLHRGEYAITGSPDLPDHDPGGLRFTTCYGLPITAAAPELPGDPVGGLGERRASDPGGYRGPTGEHLYKRWVEFRPTG
ncbi:MAG: DUF222 domain-containing protein [Austwickia sp.]|nr:DUF222 domain-containing protein [Austwickia sp.]MBK8435304.1 DUF222 domain-containing protein [Austwickia sp.]MBK9101144.1 DUF222 domain-containing protein [Austwickia sp.]